MAQKIAKIGVVNGRMIPNEIIGIQPQYYPPSQQRRLERRCTRIYSRIDDSWISAIAPHWEGASPDRSPL